MRTLSIRQPWAWLIVAGHKDLENRTWETMYRGPLPFHACNGAVGLGTAADAARVASPA